MFNIQKLFDETELTTQKLAEKSGIPKRTIDNYRSNRKKEPSFSNGMKMAEIAGMDAKDLWIKEE